MTSKVKILVEKGLTQVQAQRALRELDTFRRSRTPPRMDKNWERVLSPLRLHIRALQSGVAGRAGKPHEKLYARYLQMCIALREHLTNVATVASLRGQTIQEAALERDITELDGRIWYVWIPQTMRAKVLLSFENFRAANPRVRIITPFLTREARTANEHRWSMLLKRIAGLQVLHAGAPDSPIHVWLETALMVAGQRKPSTPAPMQWAHILPQAQRTDYLRWQKETGNGLHETAPNADNDADEDKHSF